jgi:hypothetical protein
VQCEGEGDVAPRDSHFLKVGAVLDEGTLPFGLFEGAAWDGGATLTGVFGTDPIKTLCFGWHAIMIGSTTPISPYRSFYGSYYLSIGRFPFFLLPMSVASQWAPLGCSLQVNGGESKGEGVGEHEVCAAVMLTTHVVDHDADVYFFYFLPPILPSSRLDRIVIVTLYRRDVIDGDLQPRRRDG